VPSMPRIYRSTPQGPVTQAPEPIAVIVTLRWMTSEPTDVLALALAWTRTEVQVEWQFDGHPRQDWIDAADVRRRGQPRSDAGRENPATRPPRGLDTRHPPRW